MATSVACAVGPKCKPITKYGNSTCEHCFAMYVCIIITYVEGHHCDIATFCDTIQLLVDVSLLPLSNITTFVTT